MKEIDFKKWLLENGTKKKIATDWVSRAKRVERALEIDLEKRYKKTELVDILDILRSMVKAEDIEEYRGVDLPIGKPYLSTYSSAIKKYIMFKKDC